MFNKLLFHSSKLLRAILLSLLSVSICLSSNMALAADEETKIAWDKIAAGAMVLDVRTPEEFAEGHLANAVNIPFEQVTQEFMNRGIPKDTPVVLYCRSGRRSGIAIADLVAAGYTQTFDAGAYQSLIEAQR